MSAPNLVRSIVWRLAASIPSILGIIVVVFLLMRAMPGDPAAFYAGPTADAESVAQIRTKLGLDRSLPVQFTLYMRDLAHGDLGQSLTTGQPVLSDLLARFPASLELTLLGLLFALVTGIGLGLAAAIRPGGWIDHGSRLITSAGVSLPIFFTGLLLVYVFYYLLGWAPAPFGRLDVYLVPPPERTGFLLIDCVIARDWEALGSATKQLVLPALTLGLFAMAPIARMTRSAMLGVLGSDFIRTARASGLGSRTILITYAFRNALLPVITTVGMVFSFLLGANVLVEKVFAWPGVGSYALEALLTSDFAPVQAFVLCMSILYVLLNLLIDVLYTLIDPRARAT